MYGLLSPASAAGLAAASGLNPPVEQHAISTPTRGQRRRGGMSRRGGAAWAVILSRTRVMCAKVWERRATRARAACT